MLKGTTANGFTFEVADNLADDWEIFKALSRIEENPIEVVGLIDKILGEKQTKKLEAFVKKEYGYVSTKAMTESLKAIFEALGEQGKNS